MSRDQRATNNWSLLYAQELALETKSALAVGFALSSKFPGATDRSYDFLLKGLASTEKRLKLAGVPFFLLEGNPSDTVLSWAHRWRAGAVVTDFDPLRIKREWKKRVAEKLPVPLWEVDAHNVVPAWIASPKQEYGAYTLRPKLHRLWTDYLTAFSPLIQHPVPWPTKVPFIHWEHVQESLPTDKTVSPVKGVPPGETEAAKELGSFLKNRLPGYASRRNDPNADGQSHLSPWIHFGQISAQRIAWDVRRRAWETDDGQAFLEELLVRRELSDNFCLYNDAYDTFAGFPNWAQQTLKEHRSDPRPFLYTRERFEHADTHDALWNAAQKEMVTNGKMHGYLRMYWAKKILEWSPSVDEAMATALYLNDRYSLDGRDPNGYAGVAWSLGGVHDRAWFPRPVFGKIRFMSAGGCRSKFDTQAYINRTKHL